MNFQKHSYLSILVSSIFVLTFDSALLCQTVYFGKNKVQYTEFDWKVVKGEHVDLYFYPEEEELAKVALDYAEESYWVLSAKFNQHVRNRIPFFIYSSHQHFEQTNITPGFIPEGVAGFTEYLKGRVALPFNGSYADFRHVIRHEMVHVFQLSKVATVFKLRHKPVSVVPPLWWSEGLAEYLSEDWNYEGDLFLRDLVLDNRLPSVKSLWKLGGSFLAYKVGESIHRFLGQRYGDEKIIKIYENIWKGNSFGYVFESVYGITLEELDRQWQFELKKSYFPSLNEREPFYISARTIIDKGFGNFKPVCYSSKGDSLDSIVFISPGSGYTNIYTASLSGKNKNVDVVVKGQRQAKFESFHPFDSRLGISDDNIIVFVSKFHDADALFFWDIEKRTEVARYQFKNLVSLQSPCYSPDDSKVVFSGLSISGFSDLYIFDLKTNKLTQLTNDRYADRDPFWSPDGEYIAFASDRTVYGGEGYYNIFLYHLPTSKIEYLTAGKWNDTHPRWSRDGSRIAFISDRKGNTDVYVVNLNGDGVRLTDFTGGVFEVEWAPGDNGIIFTGYERTSFNIYSFELNGSFGDSIHLELDSNVPQWTWDDEIRKPSILASSSGYKRDFSFDVAQGGAAFGTNVGVAGEAVQFLLSDQLGDHLIFMQIANNAQSSSTFLKNFSGGVTYLNLKSRLNYGFGAFHISGQFREIATNFSYEERRTGAFFLASYPFSKFNRIETSLELSYSRRNDFNDDFKRNGLIAVNSFSLIKDTSLWLSTGPIDGERRSFTFGLTTDVTKADLENFILLVDYRKYMRTTLRSSYAIRFQGRYSDGIRPERFSLGGSNSLRGYPRFSFVGSKFLLLNQEWRFPLFDAIIIRFAKGALPFPPIQGAFFFDVGNTWWDKVAFSGFYGSYGFGLRWNFGFPIAFRLDFSKRLDFTKKDVRFKFDKKLETDFFIGFNY